MELSSVVAGVTDSGGLREIMAPLHPMEIEGNWDAGRVLDWHIESSEFTGYDEFGHPQFDNKYTELGDLGYRLKYKGDTTLLDDVVRIVCSFAQFKTIDVIVPVPPSKISRPFQPVVEIAKRLGSALNIQVLPNAVQNDQGYPGVEKFINSARKICYTERCIQGR